MQILKRINQNEVEVGKTEAIMGTKIKTVREIPKLTVIRLLKENLGPHFIFKNLNTIPK